jgi:hypothetical protein
MFKVSLSAVVPLPTVVPLSEVVTLYQSYPISNSREKEKSILFRFRISPY